MTPEELRQVEEARQILLAKGLVAFPTETVYGLGADATSDDAVARIYQVKGRPEAHPLIVHLFETRWLERWFPDAPKLATLLGERFWPGPLTLVVPRPSGLSERVSAGRATVAVRVPAHPLARALLEAFGRPIAAPSANRFGRVSPTTADHVREDLGSDVDVVLDGGACQIGLESTILDLSVAMPRLLRRGSITLEQLREAAGLEIVDSADTASGVSGSLPSHYAPEAALVLVDVEELQHETERQLARGVRVGLLLPEGTPAPSGVHGLLRVPSDPDQAARQLYASLRALDIKSDVIVASLPEAVGIGAAIVDRLRRAAAPRG